MLFKECGNIERVVVLIDEKTKLSKCVGFVVFWHPEHAIRAVKTMNGKRVPHPLGNPAKIITVKMETHVKF